MASLLDRLLGRDKRQPAKEPPPSTAPQLASISVADPASLPPGATQIVGATVNLTAAAAADTFVQAVSSNPAALTIESVTIPTGQSSGQLFVTVLEGGVSVPISVTLAAQTLQATIATG